jgi:hypothetical protein
LGSRHFYPQNRFSVIFRAKLGGIKKLMLLNSLS